MGCVSMACPTMLCPDITAVAFLPAKGYHENTFFFLFSSFYGLSKIKLYISARALVHVPSLSIRSVTVNGASRGLIT